MEEECWYGRHIEEVITVPMEVAEAREDGFINGKYFGTWTTKNNIVRNMKELGLSEDIIQKVCGP
ncbi:hypothetical protein SAMN04487897_1526 [Paenibacillus sp. yr247]|uniref:hypothetical protein n=1 Tax=Paenibacillus sp. yr247 TaxID=1761880 RepID=UPI0008810CE6|nr:hypothetical protein [Paenibacillus sp. yr247]SDP23226.1 hypothetical protein SAMN04487897_1526 [Paenibacillus sp. yr247]